jgi:hypothetical protein
MKKISYRSAKPSIRPKVKPCDLPSTPEAQEGLSGSPSIGVGRGFAAPGEPVMPPTHTEEEESPYFTEKSRKKSYKHLDYDDLLKMMLAMADEMDQQDDIVLANFADFLIKKIAIQKNIDYSALFRDLLVKVVDSDILDKDDILIDATLEFNKLLKLYINLEDNEATAKRKAYQGAAARVKEYVE